MECRTDTPHALLVVGADAKSTLKRERVQLDIANRTRRTCVGLYDDLRTGLGGTTQ